jgi:hypothetical protein
VVLGGLGGLVAQAPPDTDLARTALLEHLRAGPEHPALQTRVAPGVDQFHGRGSGTAELAGLPRSAGDRLDLLLTVFDTVPIRWTVTRHVLDPDRTGLVEVLARRAGTGHRGVPQRLVVPYAGDPPSVVRVQVPDDVDWVLVAGVVGASDPQTPRHQPETERHTRFTAAP